MTPGAYPPLNVAAAVPPGNFPREIESAFARGLSHLYQVLDH
jgi:hypothetical protein